MFIRNLFGLKTENVWQLGRRNCAVFVKATGDSSESSTSLSIVKSVRNVVALICLEQWDKSDEDRVGLIGLGFAAIVALWTSTNLISVIDKLPIIPNVLEIIGILFSLVSWPSTSF
ncbi:hypothetical protein Gorai_005523 [Gossypium raimondii]|uniref:Cyanobacterial aminoacyl-tRNA synthetase CAAD domain-containing protein n=1 Tax=Gossypium raimondii TaxID=29730 RepID=A0A7J8QDH2_GOSRA|nr:hypothetical protein [Gossypium raimondii]